MNENVNSKEEPKARVLAITSGKGGVGKTILSTNIGIAIARQNKRVCVLDADIGLANINVLIGNVSEFTLSNIISGEKRIDEVLIDGPEGIKIVPGASGIDNIENFSPNQFNCFLTAIEELEKEFDYILIDTSAGITSNVTSFIMSAQDAVIVVSPEPTSLTDAYTLIKEIKSRGFDKDIYVMVNMVLSYDDSIRIFNRLNFAAKKYLNIEVKYLGYVLMDQALIASVIQQSPLMVVNPNANASNCFSAIAKKIVSFNGHGRNKKETFSEYWKNIPSSHESSDVEGIVSSPEGIEKNYIDDGTKSFGGLSNSLLDFLLSGKCSESEASEFIKKFQELFSSRFNKEEVDLKETIFSKVEEVDYSEEKIREVNLILESIYEKKYKKPIHDIRDIFFRLLEDSSVSQERMVSLVESVEKSFERHFNKPLYDVDSKLEEKLDHVGFTEERFIGLIEKIKSRYKRRFNKSLKEPIPDFVKDFNKMVDKVQEINDEIVSMALKTVDISKEQVEAQNELKKNMDGYVKDMFYDSDKK